VSQETAAPPVFGKEIVMKPLRITLAVMVFLLLAVSVFAGGKPLELSSAEPADGAVGVPINQFLLLSFSKNVVNFSVTENNVSCFGLKTSSGEVIEIEIEMGDDQMDPELKRIVKVIPVSPLRHNHEYNLTISAELQSKNGEILGEDVIIRFVTGS
jgi:hypothetical protein